MDLGIQITLQIIEDKQLGIYMLVLVVSFVLTYPNTSVRDILAWLSPPDNSSNFYAANTILKSQPDSCSWFLKGKSFLKWLEEPGFLWIKGKCKLSVAEYGFRLHIYQLLSWMW